MTQLMVNKVIRIDTVQLVDADASAIDPRPLIPAG